MHLRTRGGPRRSLNGRIERGAHTQGRLLSACHGHVSVKQPLLRLEPFCNRSSHVQFVQWNGQWSTAVCALCTVNCVVPHALLVVPLPLFACAYSLDMVQLNLLSDYNEWKKKKYC
jgi:hypothetical protein